MMHLVDKTDYPTCIEEAEDQINREIERRADSLGVLRGTTSPGLESKRTYLVDQLVSVSKRRPPSGQHDLEYKLRFVKKLLVVLEAKRMIEGWLPYHNKWVEEEIPRYAALIQVLNSAAEGEIVHDGSTSEG